MDLRRIGILAILVLARSEVLGAEGVGPVASLEVTAEPVQPADGPIVLTLSVRNTGKVPIRYWCGGPGDFPDAQDYAATIANAKERKPILHLPLSNGQYTDQSGAARQVTLGRTIHFPAAFPPLAPGVYRITVEGQAQGRHENNLLAVIEWPATHTEKVLQIEVRSDAKLAAQRDAQTIAKVRANDPFAKHIASRWPRQPVRNALVKDLNGEDVVAADRAADGLWGDADPMATDAAIVADVIVHHLKSPEGGCDLGLMDKLLKTSERPTSPKVSAALVRLAAARAPGYVRKKAIDTLDLPLNRSADLLQPQPPPDGMYHLRGDEPDAGLRQQHDAAAIGSLLELAKSADPKERRIAIRSLGDFPESPAAVAAIRAATEDDSYEVQRAARDTLDRITQPPATQP
jgi:hypothetical protein